MTVPPDYRELGRETYSIDDLMLVIIVASHPDQQVQTYFGELRGVPRQRLRRFGPSLTKHDVVGEAWLWSQNRPPDEPKRLRLVWLLVDAVRRWHRQGGEE